MLDGNALVGKEAGPGFPGAARCLGAGEWGVVEAGSSAVGTDERASERECGGRDALRWVPVVPGWAPDVPNALSVQPRSVSQAVLRLVVIAGIRGVRDVQPQLAESETQGLAGDPQHAGGLVLTAVRVLQHAG